MNNIGVLNEPFLVIPLRLFDQGLSSAVSFGAFHVYLHIRRYVWRNGKTPLGKEFYAKCLLASRVKQSVLAKRLSMSERHIRELIAELRKAGWLKTSKWQNKRVYVLGEWVHVKGCYLEVYFIDELFEKNKVRPTGSFKGYRKYSSGSTGSTAPVQRGSDLEEREAKTEYHGEPMRAGIDKENSKDTKRLKEKYVPCLSEREVSARNTCAPKKPSKVPTAWKSKDQTKPLVSKGRENAHSLAKEYRALISSNFSSPLSPLTGREMAHLAALAKSLGPKARGFLKFAVENWKLVRTKIGAKDILPTVKTIYAFREQIIFLTSEKGMGTTDTTKTDEEEGW